ncbi:hypothetical protein IFM89_036898 [Coptis chinensis]|uniref:Uncharacterized protein n=1 Tax=Coptis chinensis TaxID=261450 RepID=A0A835HZB9_9MAGN|nr:hypothetical protein IFM89_036898 [Coptis chinensis]
MTADDHDLPEHMLEVIPNLVSVYDNQSLLHPESDADINTALNQMGSFKAPGPNRFQDFFYKTYWADVGLKVSHMVKQFLEFVDGFANYASHQASNQQWIVNPQAHRPELPNQLTSLPTLCSFWWMKPPSFAVNNLSNDLQENAVIFDVENEQEVVIFQQEDNLNEVGMQVIILSEDFSEVLEE